MTYTEKNTNLMNEAKDTLSSLVQKHGTESWFNNYNVIRLNKSDGDIIFDLDNYCSYLKEIGTDRLIDDDGYEFSFDCLDTERFFELVDYIVKKYENIKKPTIMNSIWSEIIDNFIDDENILYIDGYTTTDPDETGRVIATIDLINGNIIYKDDRAKTDEYAQEIIKNILAPIKIM